MSLDRWWLVPLGVAAAGAVGLSALAVHVDRQVEQLKKAMRPLRTGRPRSHRES